VFGVQPSEFLSQSEFVALGDEEQAEYIIRVNEAFQDAVEKRNETLTIDVAQHLVDILSWTLPEEEFDRRVRRRFWDAAWENAETIEQVLQDALESDELSAKEKAEAAEHLESARMVLEHKRTIEDLPGGT
jgi:hypothetical protein